MADRGDRGERRGNGRRNNRGGRQGNDGQNNQRGNNAAGGEAHDVGGLRQGQPRPNYVHKLRELTQMEPDELVFLIANQGSHFSAALGDLALLNRSEVTELILEILVRAIGSETHPASVLQLLNRVKQSAFLEPHLSQHFITKTFDVEGVKRRQFRQSIKFALILLRDLLKRLPSSLQKVFMAYSVISHMINTIRIGTNIVDEEIDALVAEVKIQSDEMSAQLRARTEATEAAEEGRNQEQAAGGDAVREPPNDYREMSIFPSRDDMTSEPPFLREVIKKGGFKDTQHYLDVQFRLLREDFIRPLRDGIMEYRGLHNDGGVYEGRAGGLVKSWPKRLKDVRIYHNVQILNPVCAQNGLFYRIRFDVGRLKNVQWRYTKRLIYGSLLCISNDDFHNFYIATVADRNPDSLREGNLTIKFEANQDEVRHIHPDEKFLMIETSAYFEAYRHVLQALQLMRDEDVPFAPNIVLCNKDINVPRYLLRPDEPTYDLISLAPKLNEADENNEDIHRRARELTTVQILQRNGWPQAATLGLDDSQLKAVQMALTKELSIIQGPPGTGKTYIGLKIVQALLKNKTFWSSNIRNNEENSPILIVCYTNHALDQFLEGIQVFLKSCRREEKISGIVRVGGRSKSKEMENFLLNTLRRSIRLEHAVPRPIFMARLEARHEMERHQLSIEELAVKLESMERGLIHEHTLKKFMLENHYEDLVYERPAKDDSEFLFNSQSGRMGVSYLPEWLDLGEQVLNNFADMIDEAENVEPQGADAAAAVNPVAAAVGVDGAEVGNAENAQPVNAEEESEDEELIEVDNEAQAIEGHRRLLEDNDENDNMQHREERRREQHNRAVRDELVVDFDDLLRFAADQDAAYATAVPGWTVPRRSKLQRRQRLRRCLQSTNAMKDREATRVGNIWNLSMPDRWRLYRHWLQKYQRFLKRDVAHHEENYSIAAERLREILEEEDEAIMRTASVIGMTTTGAARYRQALSRIRPKIVIVEEAAEVLESHVLATIGRGCEHLVLIGDHLQLRPSTCVYELQEKYNLKYSMFERLVNNELELCTLQRQHRMRPEIAHLMKIIYPELIDDESVKHYENIRGIEKNLFFVNLCGEEHRVDDMKSYENDLEARYVVALCRHLLLQGYSKSQVTILTPYAGQMYLLRRLMPKDEFGGVRVCPVDNYQGEENDIVILSLVRSTSDVSNRQKKKSIGFVKDENRACVAMSRARKGLYAVGNFLQIAPVSDLWSKIVATAKDTQHFGNELILCCVNHPNESRIEAKVPEDFKKAPEGGCLRPCGVRLECGHACERACHSYDRQHKEGRCMKRCSKQLSCGILEHRCRDFCHPVCGPCPYDVTRLMSRCGHHQEMKCHERVEEFRCQANCTEQLRCGHPCTNKCGEEHSKCNVAISRRLPCGHRIDTPCHTPLTAPPACRHGCSDNLRCGHPCVGNCSECLQGRVHAPCQSKCGRTLVCGHECNEPCTKNCPPCNKQCENRCSHSKCSRVCGQPCIPCMEPCRWACEHYKCNQLCHQPCDRPRCDEPCKKRLSCGHQCVGLCGEVCPSLCRVCNRQELTEIFFGDEDEADAMFVQLEDCRHVFEMSGLDQWMDRRDGNGGNGDSDGNGGNGVSGDTQVQKSIDIQMKKCPRCNVPIRRNFRYSALINTTLGDIEQVKKRVLVGAGSMERNKRKQTELVRKLEEVRKIIPQALLDNVEVYDMRLKEPALSVDELHCIENIFNLLEHVIRWRTSATSLSKDFARTSTETARDLLKVIHQSGSLDVALLRPRILLSEQELMELYLEVTRYDLFKTTLEILGRLNGENHTRVTQKQRGLLDALLAVLQSGAPLSNMMEGQARNLFEELRKVMTGLGISNAERVEILNAMGLSKGHWFKCPNGHVYAIGECGGAMEVGRCPDCNSEIGGESHKLRSDNKLATEMDGATQSAWPG